MGRMLVPDVRYAIPVIKSKLSEHYDADKNSGNVHSSQVNVPAIYLSVSIVGSDRIINYENSVRHWHPRL